MLPTSVITGMPCQYAQRRPFAVMLAGDPVARPLAGIGAADMVFEMPVTPGGITRLMAVFQCEEPKEIGAIRSARQDFIPLVAALRAIFVHWGGEHDALQALNQHIIDNIDALLYDGTVFYRKALIIPPHNGFTTIQNLLDRAKILAYSLENTFGGFTHTNQEPSRNLSTIANTISVDYVVPYDVSWIYDTATKTYGRNRNQTPEIDANTQQQVHAGVVIVMHTDTQPVSDLYNRVRVTGQGNAVIYQHGVAIAATWKKGTLLSDPLLFVDASGNQIPLVPGSVWVEIVTQ